MLKEFTGIFFKTDLIDSIFLNNSFRPWLTVMLLWVVGCLNYADRVMVTSMRKSIEQAIPMNEAHFGLLTTAFLFSYALFSPLCGALADRINRSFIIIAGLFLWSIATALTAFAHNFDQLIFSRIVMGVCEASYLPAALALIADYHKGKNLSLANGIHLSGLIAGSIFAGLSGWIASTHNWGTPFIYLGMIGGLFALLLCVLLRDSQKNANHENFGRSNLATWRRFTDYDFIRLALFWATLSIAGWNAVAWMPTYLDEKFSLGQSVASVLSAGCLNASCFMGLITGGAAADHLRAKIKRSMIVLPVGGLLIAAPALFVVSFSTSLTCTLSGLACYGFFRSFSDPNVMPILCRILPRKMTATAYGFINAIGCIVGGFSIYLTGLYRDRGGNIREIFALIAFTLLIAGAMMASIRIGDSRNDISPA